MLHSTYNTFKAAVASAVSAATPAGHTTRTQVVPSLGDMTAEELKRHVAGAVLQLEDDSFAFVPMNSSVVTLSRRERFRSPSSKATGRPVGSQPAG